MVSNHCPVFRLHFTQSVASFRSCFPAGYGKIIESKTAKYRKAGRGYEGL